MNSNSDVKTRVRQAAVRPNQIIDNQCKKSGNSLIYTISIDLQVVIFILFIL